MSIGTLGKIVFEVSDSKVFTIDELKRSAKMRYAKHDVIGKKPVLEKLGPDLSELKFRIILSASNGVNPMNDIKRIRKAMDDGTAISLLVGGNVIGECKWVIADYEEGYSQVDNKGNVWRLDVDLSLQEYVEQVGDAAAATTTTTETAADDTSSESAEEEDGGITGDGDGGENPELGEDDEE